MRNVSARHIPCNLIPKWNVNKTNCKHWFYYVCTFMLPKSRFCLLYSYLFVERLIKMEKQTNSGPCPCPNYHKLFVNNPQGTKIQSFSKRHRCAIHNETCACYTSIERSWPRHSENSHCIYANLSCIERHWVKHLPLYEGLSSPHWIRDADMVWTTDRKSLLSRAWMRLLPDMLPRDS